MENIVSINQRGVLTLPKNLRVKYGLEEGGQLVVEETDDGILLRPAVTFAIEEARRNLKLKRYDSIEILNQLLTRVIIDNHLRRSVPVPLKSKDIA